MSSPFPCTVYVVNAYDGESHDAKGLFSSRERADAYREELAEHGSEQYSVNEEIVDRDRDELMGAWCVYIDAEGEVIPEATEYHVYFRPKEQPETTTRSGKVSGYRAWGATGQEATRRARSYRLEQLVALQAVEGQ